jgi:hypothetical protein
MRSEEISGREMRLTGAPRFAALWVARAPHRASNRASVRLAVGCGSSEAASSTSVTLAGG